MIRAVDQLSKQSTWSTEDSADLYRVSRWGSPYFFVNERGRLSVNPAPGEPVSIEIQAVVDEAHSRGIDLPLLLRFPDVLRSQVTRLNDAFDAAIREMGYANEYRGVYPIKVNQLREVVEEILDSGRPYGMGLECGSKAELVAALPYLDDDDTLLICNGVKDRAMLGLIVLAQSLGKSVIPVIEKPREFAELRSLSRENDCTSKFGVRVRLAADGSGRWADASGLNSKFGLSLFELMRLLEELEGSGTKDTLRLVHCHLGSQVTDLDAIRRGVGEAARVYASLVERGFGVRYLDLGGGLAIDHDETESMQVNYDLEDYARTLVATVKRICAEQDVPMPVLVTESGRALTAQHSVLIVPVIESRQREWLGDSVDPELLGDCDEATRPSTGESSVGSSSFDEAKRVYADARRRFAEGELTIEQCAAAESDFWRTCAKLNGSESGRLLPSSASRELRTLMLDQLLCDFSVFQSMLDHWAIGQPFPIMPLDRLDERPSRRATVVDLTCDSDGKVTSYVSAQSDKSFLPVQRMRRDAPMYLGFFLMGAYEDIMGDAHNLFGRVTEAHVRGNGDGREGFRIEKVLPGATVEGLLEQVQYFSSDLNERMNAIVRAKIESGAIRSEAASDLLDRYAACLGESTYLSVETGSGAIS